MGIALKSNPWPRQLALAAAIFLLHWAVLGWLEGGLGQAGRPVRPAQADMVPASLLPEPAPVPPAEPKPLPPARRLPVALPLPALPQVSADVAFDIEAPAPSGQFVDAAGGTDARPPALHDAAAPPATGAESLAQAEPEPEPKAAPEARSYRTDVPPPADLTMDVDRVDADGTRWAGEALVSWRQDGQNYRITIEAGIRVVFARVNLVVLTSEGMVDDSGYAPVKMTEKRRGRALTATHFNRGDGKITFSASQHAFGIMPGAQDKASVPLQLSAIARGDPGQLSGDIDIQVGEDKDASVYRFTVVGREEIDTRLGKIQAWRLSRPPKPGSYRSRLDVWLAPGRGWYPVRIRNTEANGAVTTQTVNNIVVTETGS